MRWRFAYTSYAESGLGVSSLREGGKRLSRSGAGELQGSEQGLSQSQGEPGRWPFGLSRLSVCTRTFNRRWWLSSRDGRNSTVTVKAASHSSSWQSDVCVLYSHCAPPPPSPIPQERTGSALQWAVQARDLILMPSWSRILPNLSEKMSSFELQSSVLFWEIFSLLITASWLFKILVIELYGII